MFRPSCTARSMTGTGAGAGTTASPSPITVKSTRVAGSAVNYAYAVKAGPWVFLNGHEAFDFERGLTAEVEGPPGNRLSGTPPLRREADYLLRRMRAAPVKGNEYRIEG